MTATEEGVPRPLIVALDDDATGVQASSGVPVVLRWDDDTLSRALDVAHTAHVITDSRSMTADEAMGLVRGAARAVMERAPDATIVLRGDSTLRGHLLEEFLAVAEVAFPGQVPVHVLAPAHPAAGRLTIDGVQVMEANGRTTPLDRTDYARDPHFGYRSAQLLEWADERSKGYFASGKGVSVHLEVLRRDGPQAVVDAIERLRSHGESAVCAFDATDIHDLELVAAGIHDAIAAGLPVIVRCGPPLASLLGGAHASSLLEVPEAHRCLVVCGSWVGRTGRQLAAVERWSGRSPVLLDVTDALRRGESDPSLVDLARRTSSELDSSGWSVVATPRRRLALSEREGRALARALANLVAAVDPPPDLIVTKGGITTSSVVRDGLGASMAMAQGPVAPGVSWWRTEDGSTTDVVVVPGNVGGDDLLVDLISRAVKEPEVARSVP